MSDSAMMLPKFLAEQLYQSRTILLCDGISPKVAALVSAQLLALSAVSDDPITLVLSSPGGHVESGDVIHDMIRYVKPTVRILGTGWVASAGALIFIAAEREHRFCLPNTRFLLHQPSGGASGHASDIMIEADEILKMRARLNQMFADRTGQPLARIEKDTHRNFWLSPEEAVAYGLVGKIVRHVGEIV